jgi:hypothetical protein
MNTLIKKETIIKFPPKIHIKRPINYQEDGVFLIISIKNSNIKVVLKVSAYF